MTPVPIPENNYIQRKILYAITGLLVLSALIYIYLVQPERPWMPWEKKLHAICSRKTPCYTYEELLEQYNISADDTYTDYVITKTEHNTIDDVADAVREIRSNPDNINIEDFIAKCLPMIDPPYIYAYPHLRYPTLYAELNKFGGTSGIILGISNSQDGHIDEYHFRFDYSPTQLTCTMLSGNSTASGSFNTIVPELEQAVGRIVLLHPDTRAVFKNPVRPIAVRLDTAVTAHVVQKGQTADCGSYYYKSVTMRVDVATGDVVVLPTAEKAYSCGDYKTSALE